MRLEVWVWVGVGVRGGCGGEVGGNTGAVEWI